MEFKELKLSKELIENLSGLGFSSMTPIQKESLPIILEGADIIGQAKTGSGKTAAFGLGVLNSLNLNSTRPQSLVLCPTRELADQVAKEIRKLARLTSNVKITTVCGGTSEYHQIRSLAHGAHIIVGTPGRVLKFLKDAHFEIDEISSFVLDEADRMLDMGFYESIREIETFLPLERQTLLFSATYPDEIIELSSALQTSPHFVKVDSKQEESTIEQIFFELNSHREKLELLSKLLAKYTPESTVVFCKTKKSCDEVADYLQSERVSALAIHGDHEQRDRTLAMTKFSNKSCLILVATDVAARGIDVKELSLVVNFDLSTDPEVHVHRIGRTGRIGHEGLALSLFVSKEDYKVEAIEEYMNLKFNITHIDDFDAAEGSYQLTPPMTTIFISGGKKDKIRPGDIVGAIIGTSGIDASDIGDITVMNILSYVAISTEKVGAVLEGLSTGKIKKRRFRVGLA
ncbi:ATP-dependent RNA helicase DbpA [Halobacteriovorax sp. JY17]|uniref:ATP-dependent RNA helicase DbpA n=1 Tax=Halobacteriovorax sp. JY17 TaxID=2014617 RepID=UPI000C68565B|nr:ATP-dependent RNA helicase DbpA [Halobacteriovorax sp. JY17]PIK15213.1 MAG: ATP-dependent RNA helicase DbpA [Halobacteriovorax sp. JY17]